MLEQTVIHRQKHTYTHTHTDFKDGAFRLLLKNTKETQHQNARSHPASGPKLQAGHAIFLSAWLPLALNVSWQTSKGTD